MCTRVHVHVHVHVYVWKYMYTGWLTCTCTCISRPVWYMAVCSQGSCGSLIQYTCTCTCTCVYMCVQHVHVHVHVYMCIYNMHMYTCTYLHASKAYPFVSRAVVMCAHVNASNSKNGRIRTWFNQWTTTPSAANSHRWTCVYHVGLDVTNEIYMCTCIILFSVKITNI